MYTDPGFGWFGSLTDMVATEMYRIKLSTQQTLIYAAPPVSLDTVLQLSENWNYLPYFRHESRPLAAGLPNFPFAPYDHIKSQRQYALFCILEAARSNPALLKHPNS